MKKATDIQIQDAYKELKSCKKVANLFGMCPQSVHERLKKLGINEPINILTDIDKKEIESIYEQGFKVGDGKLKDLSSKIGRTVQFIARYAKTKGLTNKSRSLDVSLKDHSSKNMKRWHKENEHPKGMLGKTHSKEMSESMSSRVKKYFKNLTPQQKADHYAKMVKTARENGTYNRKHGSWNSAWRTIGNKTKFFRSTWEANYARYLEHLKVNAEILDWDHEPKTFWFLDIMRGSRSYLPDFKITNLDGTHYWVEVKGWMDARSKTKLKRFSKYYPDEKLVLIQAPWFKANSSHLQSILLDWES